MADINGTSGDDILDGTPAGDLIKGFAGDDILNGGDGIDELRGGKGDDILNGGLDKDNVFGGSGNDTFIIEGSHFGDNIDGGSDTDTLDLSGWSLAGTAWLVDLSAEMYEFLPNSSGADGTYTLVNVENVIGSDFDDDLRGDANSNELTGGLGDDILAGKKGADRLIGGNGSDELRGGSGDDFMDGGNDADLLLGGKGDDILNGGDGIDELHGGDGDDILNGGGSRDSVFGDDGNDTILITESSFGDDIDGGGDIDTLDLSGWTFSSIAWLVDLSANLYEFLPNNFGSAGTYTLFLRIMRLRLCRLSGYPCPCHHGYHHRRFRRSRYYFRYRP